MIEITGSKQLFLDDYAIESTKGIIRKLHKPGQNRPVLRAEVEAGQFAVQSRNSPQWNPDKQLWEWFYWAFYQCEPFGPRAITERRVSCYATSTDLINWDKPSLGLFEWNGSKDNNICFLPESNHVDRWGNGRFLYHCFRDDSDPDPDRRYKGMFDSRDRWLAVSPDGFNWKELSIDPIPSQDESHFFFDEGTNLYTLMHKLPTEWGRSVWMSQSSDFIKWTDPILVMHTDEIDRENRKSRLELVRQDERYLAPPLYDGVDYIAETYQMAVMPYEGVYVGFPLIFNPSAEIPPPHGNFTALNQTELTVSRNLLDWTRVCDREIFMGIDHWDGTSFNTAQILPAGRPIIKDDSILIFNVGYRYRGPQELYQYVGHDYEFEVGAMNVATVRLDGFVSFDGLSEGVVLTKPFTSGGDFKINGDALKGQITVDLVDSETLDPIPGLKGSFTGDSVDAVIIENTPPDRVMRAKFTLKDSSLYAFWLD